MSRKLSIPLAALSMCLLGFVARAQDRPSQPATLQSTAGPSGTFAGRLNGAGSDGATVTLTNTATGESQTAVTGSDGSFSISNLTPGSYRAVVRLKSGLQLGETAVEISSTRDQVQVTFNSVAAATGGPLEIEGRTPTLQTDSAEVSRSYDSQLVRSVPLLDRQHQELVTLMPGVSPPVAGAGRIDDPQRTRSFNVNGLPAYENLYNQDGAYDNEPFNGRPLRTEPNEAVQALDVRTSNYNAEYGVSAGSWSSTVTRPGTNSIHGSLFEFNTNSYFRSGRSLPSSLSTPRFNTNQFGGSAGGPVLPDRMFWFLSYEGYIQRGSEEAVATVPSADMRSGDFSRIPGVVLYNPRSGNASGLNRSVFPGSTIPDAQFNLASQRILGSLPAANLPGYSNNLAGSVRLLDDDHRMDAKLDHRFSGKSTGFFRYGFTQASVDQGSLLGALGSPLNAEFRGTNAVASLTHIFNKNLLAEFRVGYDRYRNRISPWGDSSSPDGFSSAFPGGFPSIAISGFSQLGLPANVPRTEIANVYDGATNWMLRSGMHSLKLGIAARALQANGFANPIFGPAGSFTFGPGATLGSSASAATLSPAVLQANAFAAFLTGAPTQSGISAFATTPAYRQMQYAAYITDTVNLFQKLYLEFGVRYDIFSPVEASQPGGAVVFDPASNSVTPLGVNGAGTRSTRTDVNNVAPRVGLAFRPVDRLVFRAGYGIHYFPVPFSLLAFNPAMLGVQAGIAGGLTTTAFAVPVVPPAGAAAPNLPYFVGSRDMATPYVQTFSAMLQGDLGNGFLLDAGYVGNLGRQLPYSLAQTGLPGSGLAGLSPGRTALTTERGTTLTSNYNSLQVNLTKKFAAGLALSGAYTYSKALDYGFNLADPFSRASNYGPADWDRTHIFSLSHDWRLPFARRSAGWASRLFGDWELTGILRWATGTPYTVTADPLACACLGVAAVPAAFQGAGQESALSGASSFNPALFGAPAAGTFGSLRRNGFRGPDFFVYNAALFRNFAVRENIKLELRGEAYNVTNTSNFTNPVANTASPGFGATPGTLDGLAGRQFQVGARLLF